MRARLVVALVVAAAIAAVVVLVRSAADGAPAVIGPGAPPARTAVGTEERVSPDAPPVAADGTERHAVRTDGASELDSALWVTGHVVLPAGTPADEAPVVVAKGARFADGSLYESPVDAGGGFRVAFSDQTRRGSLELRSRFLFLPRRVVVALEDGGEVAPVTLEPELGGRLGGSLDVAADSPLGRELLVGATVRLRPGNDTLEVGPDLVFDFGARDADRTYRVEVRAERFEPLNWVKIGLDPLQDKRLDLTVDAGVVVEGLVLDPDGAPVHRADVEVVAREHVPSRGTLKRSADGRTDRDGRFRVGGVGPGKTRVVASREGFATRVVELGQRARGDVVRDVELRLGVGEALAGRVEWADGTPASGARVSITDHSRWNGETTEWRADDQGRFAATGLSGGPFAVGARDSRRQSTEEDGWRRTMQRVLVYGVPAGADDVRLVLGEGTAVEGVVTDDLGVPLRSYVLVARPAVVSLLRQPDGVTVAVEDARGRFAITLGDGAWELVAHVRDRTTSAFVVELPASPPRIELVLPRLGTLRCLVLDPAGAAVAGARLLLDDAPVSETDARGVATLDLEPAAYEVAATAPGTGLGPSRTRLVTLEPGETVESQLVLTAGARLVGRVLDLTGAPVAKRTVRIEGVGAFEVEAATGADGRFELEQLGQGTYRITVEASKSERRAFGERYGEFDPDLLEWFREVALSAGETVDVTLWPPELRPAVITGNATMDGDVVAVGTIFFTKRGEHGRLDVLMTETDEGGRYRVVLPRPGTWEVSIEWHVNDAWREDELEVEVPDVEHWTVDLRGTEEPDDG